MESYHLVQRNWLVLTRNGVPKAEAPSVYFSRVLSTDHSERPTVDRDNGSLTMDHEVIKKGTVLRLLQHLKPDMSNGPDESYPRIMKNLVGVSSEPLEIQFDVSLRLSRD